MLTIRQTTTCTKCEGTGGFERQHPSWGSRTCPEAYIKVPCDLCDGSGDRLMTEHIMDLLIELESFLDNQADAEIDENGRTIGNDAMKLLSEVKDAMARLEGK